MLRLDKVKRALKLAAKYADKRAEKERGRAIASLSDRRARLSEIAMANAGDLKGIAIENGRLIFEDELLRSAVKSRAQIVMISNPDYDRDDPASQPRVQAVVVDLALHDPLKAIAELNKMDGVYKETMIEAAEIHIHAGERLEHDAQTTAQLKDPELRVPILGSKADQSRYRKVSPKGKRSEVGDQRSAKKDIFKVLKK